MPARRRGVTSVVARFGAGHAAHGLGVHFTSGFVGYVGTAVKALGLAARPEPLRLSAARHPIVAVLAVASLMVFISAWHPDTLELAFAPVFAAMSIAGLVFMGLLAWRSARSKDDQASQPQAEVI